MERRRAGKLDRGRKDDLMGGGGRQFQHCVGRAICLMLIFFVSIRGGLILFHANGF